MSRRRKPPRPTQSELRILRVYYWVSAARGMPPSQREAAELAGWSGRSQAFVMECLNRLAMMGLVLIGQNDEHARHRSVRVTRAGKRLASIAKIDIETAHALSKLYVRTEGK